MRKYLMLSAVAFVTTLTGCASYYKAPPDVQTARLVFVTDMRPVMIQRFEDADCSRSKDGVRLAYIDPVFSSGKHAGPIDVEANRELVITTHKKHLGATVVAGWECTITTRFVPGAGRQYEVHFMSAKGGCTTRIFHVKNTQGHKKSLVPEASAVRNDRICYTSSA